MHGRTDTGEFVRLMRGVYYPAEAWSQLDVGTRTIMLMRSLQTLHPQWVFTGMHAALVHNLYYSTLVLDQGPFHLLTTRGGSQVDDVSHVKRHHVDRIDFEVVQGIRVATAARTVVDCANIYEFRNALGVADSYLRNGGFLEDIYHAAHAYITPQLIDVLRYADANSESGGESFSRATMIEMRYVPPILQVPCRVTQPDMVRRLDYLWFLPNGSRWAFECDGMQKYIDPESNQVIGNRVADQVVRDKQVIDAGIQGVTHFTLSDAIRRAPLRQMLAKANIPQVQGPALLSSTTGMR
ncbi:hypothetical protein [Bifidobacterium gallicum]|nr:hypothetical protein [Bifidobacterium gallicum]